MLGKILKYDLKSMFKSLSPLYLILIGLALLNKLCMVVSTTFPIIKILTMAITVLFVFVLVGTFIFTFIVSIKRFYTNILKDEGYLTNTLPVKKSSIILSKIISSTIFFIISMILIILALAICYYQKGMLDSIIKQFSTAPFDPTTFIIALIVYLILGYINYMQLIYLSLAFGQTHNSNKIVYSFVSGIVIYSVVQVLNLIGLGIFVLIKPELIDMFNTNVVPSYNIVNQIFIYGFILQLIYLVLYYLLTNTVLKNKLNLE